MKQGLKSGVMVLAAILMSPITLVYFALSWLFNKDAVLASSSQLLSLIPGKIGVYLRTGFFRFTLAQCSPDAVISFMVLFSQADTEIGKGVYIGPQCNVGLCSIGENTLVGSGVHIMSGKGQHNFDDIDTPIKDQGGEFQMISIGKNCWLGNGVMVMANIGEGCVVGAGSVVIHDVPAFSIVGGNPAKVLKSRLG